MYEFTNMVVKPAKNTDDLRMLLVEMETKIKTVEDITGEVVSSAHAKNGISLHYGPYNQTTHCYAARRKIRRVEKDS